MACSLLMFTFSNISYFLWISKMTYVIGNRNNNILTYLRARGFL